MTMTLNDGSSLGPGEAGALSLLVPTHRRHFLEELRRRRERTAYTRALALLLSRIRWDVYSTLTFSDPASFTFARRSVERFVTRFGPRAYAYVSYERGGYGSLVHVHLLLGGLGQTAKEDGWEEWHCGRVGWSRYMPGGGAEHYVPKSDFDSLEPGGFLGAAPVWYRPKKRRRRRRRSRS